MNVYEFDCWRNYNQSLGLTISGGVDTSQVTQDIKIDEIGIESPFYNRLKPGDIILEVNDISLKSFSHIQAVKLLKNVGPRITFKIARSESCKRNGDFDKLYHDISIQKPKNAESLGIELSCVMYIKSVDPNSLAYSSGLRMGDRLIKLNGIDIAHLSLIDTTNILRREVSRLKVARLTSSHYHDDYANNLNYCSQEEINYVNHHQPVPNSNLPRYMKSLEQPQVNNKPSNNTCSRIRSRFSSMNDLNDGFNGDQYRSFQQNDFDLNKCQFSQSVDNLNGLKFKSKSFETLHDDGTISFRVERLSDCYGAGIRICGGNNVGIFVADVLDESPAYQVGIEQGDSIIEINTIKTDNMTKEEAVQLISASDNFLDLKIRREKSVFESFMRNLANNSQTGDLFHIRAHYNYFPVDKNSSKNQKTLGSGILEDLFINKGDILRVSDTMPVTYKNSWKATKLYPALSREGIIPNKRRAIDSQNNIQPAQPTSIFYERVINIGQYPYLRPIVIYGPFNEIIRNALIEYSHAKELRTNGFELPPITANNDYNLNQTSMGVVRLSAIKAIMKKHMHPVLDILPSAVEKLQFLGIPSIVLVIKPNTRQDIKAYLKKYNKAANNNKSLSKSKISALSKELWADIDQLNFNYEHVITENIPLDGFDLFNLNPQVLDKSVWLENVMSIVRHQQLQSVWLNEESTIIKELGEINHSMRRMENKINEKCVDASIKVPPTIIPRRPRPPTDDSSEKRSTSVGEIDNDSFGNVSSLSSDRNLIDQNDPILMLRMATYRQITNHHLYKSGKQAQEEEDLGTGSDSDTSSGAISSDTLNEGEIRIQKQFYNSLNAQRIYQKSFELKNAEECDRVKNLMYDVDENERRIGDMIESNTFKCGKNAAHLDKANRNFYKKIKSLDSVEMKKAQKLNSSRSKELHQTIDERPKRILAECVGQFDERGGELILKEHQVKLTIPEGALVLANEAPQKIFIRIYEDLIDHEDYENQIYANKPQVISPIVMCGPRGLAFEKPVRLTMPKLIEGVDPAYKLLLLHGSADSASDQEVESFNKTGRGNVNLPDHWHEIDLTNHQEDDTASFPSGGTAFNSDQKTFITVMINNF